MLLERLNIRIETTLVVSLAIHAVLLSVLIQRQLGAPVKRIELTEVEFQAEAPPPTEIEKLMNRITASPSPPAPSRAAVRAADAVAELERTSFQKVVGVRPATRSRADIVTETDLTRLASLPKFDRTLPAAAPQGPPALKRLELVRAAPSAADELAGKVVPLAELPPSDFGADLSRRSFQQPEMIIKQVKAERRAQLPTPGSTRRLSLSRDSLITGEVKDRDLLHRENPQAPRWLEEKGIEAEVVVSFVVNPDGDVGDKVFVQKTSGYADLDRLAIEALKKFVFAPLPLNLRQVEQSGTIVFRFTFHR